VATMPPYDRGPVPFPHLPRRCGRCAAWCASFSGSMVCRAPWWLH